MNKNKTNFGKRGQVQQKTRLFVVLTLVLLPTLLFGGIGSLNIASKANSTRQESLSHKAEQRNEMQDLTSRLVALSQQYQVANKNARKQLLSEIRNLSAARQVKLAAMMNDDPEEVLRVALPAQVRDSLPPSIRDQYEQQIEVEGEIEVSYQDWETESFLFYSLNVGGERLSLHFAEDAPTDYLTGAKVRVKGVRVGDAVALESGKKSVRATASGKYEPMAMTVPPNTFGEQKVLVLLVNFQDKQTQPWTVSQVQSTVFGTVNNFYRESSYQQTWLTGDVYGWYTLPISSSTCDTSAIATYAKQAATAAGVNLSAYNRLVYAFPSLSTCGFTGASTVGGSPSQSWINGSMTLRTVGHELGHGLGLYHGRAMDCHPNVIGSSCPIIEYGDSLDILGQTGVTAHSHAGQKERLGWLNYGSSPGITTVQSSGTYWIDPYESVGSNPKALKILKAIDSTTGVKTWYYVEFRRPIGFDSSISGNSNFMNGVLVHTETEPYGRDTYLLDMTPETTSFSDAALVVGRSYNDPNINATITPLSVSSTGAAVSVTFGPQPCVRTNPTVSLSSSGTQWFAAGSTMTYQVLLTSNDSGCTASNFNLQANVPSGWSAAFSNAALSLPPGGSATTTVTITSPSTTTDGFYNLSVVATNGADASYSASCSMTCAVVSSLSVGVSSNQSSYTRNQTVSLTATVNALGSPVSGTTVNFTMTKSNGAVVTGTAISGADGRAVFTYRFNKRQDPTGTYQVSASANLNGITGNGVTSFVVQ